MLFFLQGEQNHLIPYGPEVYKVTGLQHNYTTLTYNSKD